MKIDLAARLQAAVKSAANAVEGQAAALYLLDEGTSELKLRSCWGLPFDRLTAPARRLQGSLADLEALLGHAVVLENTSLMPGWNAPEDFAAAICVPVSSSTTVLGTLWIFCDETRDFTDAQTSVAEIVAGKIATDLEREMLLHEGVKGGQLPKAMDSRRTDAEKPASLDRSASGRLANRRLGGTGPGLGRGCFTIGSACPTDSWPAPWAKASMADWSPRFRPRP